MLVEQGLFYIERIRGMVVDILVVMNRLERGGLPVTNMCILGSGR